MLRRIATHCQALYEILTSTFPAKVVWVKGLAPFISPDKIVSWLSSTATVFHNISNSTNAIPFSTSACDFVQYLSNTREGDFIKASVFDTQGLTLSMTSQYKSSILYHKEAAKIYTASNNRKAVGESYNNLGNVYNRLGLYNKAKEYHEKALAIKKRFFAKKMPMLHQAITTWEIIITTLESTMKQKNTTRKHWSSLKRFLARNMPMSHQAMETWEMIICSLDSTMKQKNTTRKH